MIHVYPLSFKEISENYSDLYKAWEEYKTFGGMPYTQSLESAEDKILYLKNLIDEIYLKDILDKKKINNKNEILNILLSFISSSVGSLSNPLKISNQFNSEFKINIKSETIAKYLTFFKEANIINSLKRYDIKDAKYFETPLKYYFSDIGLRNASISSFNQLEENCIMENVILNELIRRGFKVDVGIIEDRHYVKKNL